VKFAAEEKFQSLARPGSAEKAFIVLVLLASLGAFMNLTVTGPVGNRGQDTGMLGMQVVWSFAYFIVLLLYFRKCDRPFHYILGVAPLIPVVALALASISWSQDPQLTLRRSIALALTLVFGVYFGRRFTTAERFRLLAWAFAICIVFSFIFELLNLNPNEGVPGWYGIFYHKVELGRNMVLGALVFLFWKKVEPRNGGFAWAGFVTSVILVWLARDVTSLLVLALLLALLPYLQWTLRKSLGLAVSGMALLLTAGATLVIWVVSHWEAVTVALGKDPTLTGRVPLWILSTVMALRRPWFGYGYNAFWLQDQAYVRKIWHLLRWQPPHAHNGTLELWLELGLIGAGWFLLAFAYYLARSMRFFRANSDAASAWPLMFLAFFFFSNLTEGFFLVSNSIYFILYVAMATSMCATERETRIFPHLVLAEQRKT
jgi:exopolysaccharide production protein ExoQ